MPTHGPIQEIHSVILRKAALNNDIQRVLRPKDLIIL